MPAEQARHEITVGRDRCAEVRGGRLMDAAMAVRRARWTGCERPIVGPLLIAFGTLALFHAVVAIANPDYWGHRAVWDEGFYLQIARTGYSLPGGDYGRYTTLPFSPGYPLLLRGIAWLGGVDPLPLRAPLGAALFVGACQALGWLLRAFSSDHRRNNLTILAFAIWPGALYFCSGYAESLYVPLLLLSLGCMLRRRWFLAAWLAAACLFTRTPAVIVVGTLAAGIVVDAVSARGRAALGRAAGTLAVTMPIASLGLVGYVLMTHAATGDWFAFRKSYVAWQPCEVLNHRNLDLRTVYDALLLTGLRPQLLLAVIWALLVPVLVCLQRRAMPLLLSIFAAIAWSFFVWNDWQLLPYHDMLRWLAVVFPAHFALVSQLARLPAGWRLAAGLCWFGASAAAYAWCVYLFVTGQPLS